MRTILKEGITTSTQKMIDQNIRIELFDSVHTKEKEDGGHESEIELVGNITSRPEYRMAKYM